MPGSEVAETTKKYLTNASLYDLLPQPGRPFKLPLAINIRCQTQESWQNNLDVRKQGICINKHLERLLSNILLNLI